MTLGGCGASDDPPAPVTPPPPTSKWPAIRSQAAPQVVLTTVFGAPYPQPIANDGWEDGLFISRDGLHLYAMYAPCDLISFSLVDFDQRQAASFLRGPTLGMDLTTSPPGTGATTWLQSDVIHATRASASEPFSPWRLSSMATPIYGEGAVVAQGPSGGGTWDLFAYTSSQRAPDYRLHICLRRGVPYDPTDGGPAFLPAPVTTSATEDNPHIERMDAANLVLFFDSPDRPGGSGQRDLWFSTSADDGATWAVPAPVTSLNTAAEEMQPHLFRSSAGALWLYYAATNPADGRLGIYRASQSTAGDWNSWTGPELVVGAGNTLGVGEPTLTANGDISFVAVIGDPNGTPTDGYDCDPWFLPRLPTGVVEATPRCTSVVTACMMGAGR